MLPDIAETSERMVYSVASERNNLKRYRVDLLANNGAGACSCTDYATRRQPNLDAGMQPMSDGVLCKHLKKVHRKFLYEILKSIAQVEENQET